MLGKVKLDSLKSRAALFCVLQGWVLILVVAGIYYLDGRRQLRTTQLAHLQEQVERTAADLDERIRTRQQLVVSGAAPLRLTPEQLARDARALVARFHYLKGPFNSAILYDRNGVILADYPHLPERIGLSVAERGYFQRTRDTLAPQISEPFRAKTATRRHLIVFTAPILTPDGRFAGMLGASLELFSPEFFGELPQIRVGQHGYITLVAQKNRHFLYHPDPAKIDRPIPPRAQAPALYHAVVDGWSGVSEGPLSLGGDGLVALRQLSRVDWVLGGAISATEAYQPLRRFTHGLLLVGLIMMLVLPALAWFAMRRMLAPLASLHQQLQRWQDPATARTLEVSGASELTETANTLNAVLLGRQAFEQRLGEREAFFRALNDASPLGVLVSDCYGRIRYCNQAGAQLLALASPGGGNWLQHVDGADRLRLEQLLAGELRADALTQLRCHFVLPPGRRLLLELRLTLLDEAQCLAILLDVTRQDAEQQALAGERERALAILGSISDAVVLTNYCDEVEYLNLPAQALLGVKTRSLLGRRLGSVAGFRQPDSRVLLSAHELDELTAAGHAELDMETADGGTQPVVLALSSVTAAGVMQGYRVYVLHDDTERRQREQAQRYQALHDPLTGLLNRRGLLLELNRLLGAGRAPSVVVMLDLDYFKAVNDKGGHQAGDLMLQAVADILVDSLRDSDRIARLGGDEFALALNHCDEAAAQQVLDKIRQRIEDYRLTFSGQRFALSASIGLTSVRAVDARPEEVLSRADRACYAAKFAGRNRIAVLD